MSFLYPDYIPFSKVNITYPGHNAGISKSFVNSLERDNLDLCFICSRNTRISAHKIVLATVSEFLKSLVLSNQDDVVYISLPNVERRHVKILIDFIYEGMCRINYSDLVALKDLVCVLGVNLPNSEIVTVDTVHNQLFTNGCNYGDISLSQIGSSDLPIKGNYSSCEMSYDKPDPRCPEENKVQKVRPFPSQRLAIRSSDGNRENAAPSGVSVRNTLLSVNKEIYHPVLDTVVQPKQETIIDEVIVLDSDDEECIPDSSFDIQTKCSDDNQTMKEFEYSHEFPHYNRLSVNNGQKVSQSDSWKAILQDFYEKNRFLSGRTLKKLSEDLGLSRRYVYHWFLKKQMEEKTSNWFLHNHPYKKKQHFTNYNSSMYKDKENCMGLSLSERMPLTMIVQKIRNSKYRVKQGTVKRNHAMITQSQCEILEEAYSTIKFPDKETKIKLSLKTGVPFETVKQWFYKRRYKDKKSGIPVMRNVAFTGFSCEVCSKSFATKTILRKHFDEHNDKKPYKCEICDIELSNKQLLRYHLDIHKTSLGISLDSLDILN